MVEQSTMANALTEESLFSPETLQNILKNHSLLRQVAAYVRKTQACDTAHDYSHLCRVASNALLIARSEGGNLEILLAAALLHDIKSLPKNHPEARLSSSYSAKHAGHILQGFGFSRVHQSAVEEAILCHSFSARFLPRTLEAKILQDADRLDSLGAVGIARLFAVSGSIQTALYCPQDPMGRAGRSLDDKRYAVDHFFQKIFKMATTLWTQTGKDLALARVEVMKQYLDVFEREIDPAFETFLIEW